MKHTRIEEDFLGQREIENTRYYGIQTMRALENFPITGYTLHKDLVWGLAVVKKAAAKANMDIGLLNKEISCAIVWAADEIIAGKHSNQFLVDPIQGGAGTSMNMNVNEVIANLALEHIGCAKGSYNIISPNTHVNMAQSTNDAFPTAGHLAMIKGVGKLLPKMIALADIFAEKTVEFDDIIKMGRTHLQDAIPIRLGQEFGAYEAVLRRDIARVKDAAQYLYVINIGATAVGTGLNAERAYIEKAVSYIANQTSFPVALADNLVDGTQNTDCYTMLSSTLKVCMTNLSKIANDLRLMASGPRAGLYEIILPPRQPGSSIMPGKINPVMAEVINQIAFQVVGNDLTITMASEAGQFELNVMEPVLFHNLLQSLEIMANGFDVFASLCVKGISANKEQMSGYVENSIGIITAVNPHIGYEKAAKVAKEALSSGRRIWDLCIDSGYLTKEQLEIILEPKGMTTIGISGRELLNMEKQPQQKAVAVHYSQTV